MTSLFNFEDRVHTGVCPTLSPCLSYFHDSYVRLLEHIEFPAEPRLECRRRREATLLSIGGELGSCLSSFPSGSDEDEPTDDSP